MITIKIEGTLSQYEPDLHPNTKYKTLEINEEYRIQIKDIAVPYLEGQEILSKIRYFIASL